MDKPWVVGIDVGLVNIGVAFYNLQTREAHLYQVNPLLEKDAAGVWRNVKYEERCVFGFVRKLDAEFEAYFQRAHFCRIEKQMRGKGKGKGDGKSTFVVIGHCLETFLRVKYPHMDCAAIAPQTVRGILEKKFGVAMTTKGRKDKECDYDRSKDSSKELCVKLMGKDKFDVVMERFKKLEGKAKKRWVKKIDACEAMLIVVAFLVGAAKVRALSGRKLKFLPGEAANIEPVKGVKFVLQLDFLGGSSGSGSQTADSESEDSDVSESESESSESDEDEDSKEGQPRKRVKVAAAAAAAAGKGGRE